MNWAQYFVNKYGPVLGDRIEVGVDRTGHEYARCSTQDIDISVSDNGLCLLYYEDKARFRWSYDEGEIEALVIRILQS